MSLRATGVVIAALTARLSAQSAGDPPPPPPTWAIDGSLGLGWRFLDVDGDRAQYDEDLNLESGLVLRELVLRGRRNAARPLDAFLLEAHGLGDPHASARGELGGNVLRARASWFHDESVGSAEDDLRPFDFTRDRASLRVESADDGPVRAGLEATWGRRDGLQIGARSVDFGFVQGFPVERRETSLGLAGDVSAPVLGFDVALDGGIERLEADESFDFALRSPSDPSQPAIEDFDGENQADSFRIAMRARRTSADRRLAVDFGGHWLRADGDGTFTSFESGILFAADDPYERTTEGQADMSAEDAAFDAGARYELAHGLALHVRARRIEEDESGTLLRTTTITEFGTTSSFDQEQHVTFQSSALIGEGGFDIALGESADLDLTLAYGRDHQVVHDVADGTDLQVFDDTLHEYGGAARFTVEPASSCSLSLSCGYDIAPTRSPLAQHDVTFGDDRVRFAEARLRCRPRSGLTIAASARHDDRLGELSGAVSHTDALALSTSVATSPDWSIDASWTLRLQESEADITVLLPPPDGQVPATVTFSNDVNIGSLGLCLFRTERVQPRLAASEAFSDGDASFRYGSVDLDVPWHVRDKWTVGADLDWHRYDDRIEGRSDDYSAVALVLYVRIAL